MEVRFDDEELRRLYRDVHFCGSWSQGIVKSFRQKVQFIAAATDERDLIQWSSLRFKRLQGDRSHQHSIRLNDQFRVVFEIEPGTPKNTIVVKSIEDYH